VWHGSSRRRSHHDRLRMQPSNPKLSPSTCLYLSLIRGNMRTLLMMVQIGNKLSLPRWCGNLKLLHTSNRRLQTYLYRLLSNLFKDLVPSLFKERRLPNSRQEEKFLRQFQLSLRLLVISRLSHYPHLHIYSHSLFLL
jgi:hypothetical protein